MSNEKFTQEPWEISDMSGVDAMDNFTVCFHIGVSSTGEMIADCQSDNKADYERVRANAFLMKAAPVMYRKLGRLEEVFRSMVRECVPGSGKARLLWACIDDIIELREKARGEA